MIVDLDSTHSPKQYSTENFFYLKLKLTKIAAKV